MTVQGGTPAPDEVNSRLLDEAIDLMIRRQGGPDNPVTLRLITVWRARSPAHERIWQRVAEAHGMAGQALSRETPAGRMSRRNLMLGGLTLLGGGAFGSWAVPRLRLQMLADHITTTAELLPITLPDGSRITLGPDSAIVTPTPEHPREVRLLQGMAWLDVVPDASRPFVLKLDGVETRIAAAGFEVSQEAGIVSLAVARDSVELVRPLQHGLSAGAWMRLDPLTGRFEEGSRDPAMAGLWQQGAILAEAEPLDALVARIARWLPGRVVIADSSIARTRISGLFDITDPERALDAAVRPTGARLRRVSGLLTVISAV